VDGERHLRRPRGRIVLNAARLLEENKEELAQLLTHEEGKTIAESRGELQRSINVAEFCAGESRRMTGETIPSELALNFAYTIKQPLGVVACVTPWNFPVAIPIWKIAPALGRRQHRRIQTGVDHAGDCRSHHEIFEAAGFRRRLNLVIGSGPKPATRSSIIPRSRRFRSPDRTAWHSSVRTGFTARREGAMRDGWKEPGRRTRRRRHGPGGGVDGQGVWIVGTTLHGDEPRDVSDRSRTSLSNESRNALSRCALVRALIRKQRWDRVSTKASSRRCSITSTSAVKTARHSSAEVRVRPATGSTKVISSANGFRSRDA
jgi:hypothetical protein